MTELVEGASILITAVGGLLAAALVQLGRILRLARSTADQVGNDHQTNLRDDIDAIKKSVDDLGNDLRVERGRITRVDQDAHDTHQDIYNRLRAIEGRRR